MHKYLSKFVKNPMAAGQDGPPDLDELFKDLKNKVDNMFNVKSKNNSNDRKRLCSIGKSVDKLVLFTNRNSLCRASK